MRHRIYGKHLGRDKNERRALFRNLVQALILQEKIQTTHAKAKAIKGLVDKLINQAKAANYKARQFVTNKEAADKLFAEIVPRLGSRSSGYTSLVRTATRVGDGAMMVQIRLLLEDKTEARGKKLEVRKKNLSKSKKRSVKSK